MTLWSHGQQNSFDSITYCTWIHKFIEILLLMIKNCTLLEKNNKVKVREKENEMK